MQTCFSDGGNPKQSQVDHADTVYLNIKDQIEKLNEAVKLLLEESNQTENEGIKVSDAAMTVGIVGIGMGFAKQFVILSMAAYVLLSIPAIFLKKKTEDSQEV